MACPRQMADAPDTPSPNVKWAPYVQLPGCPLTVLSFRMTVTCIVAHISKIVCASQCQLEKPCFYAWL